MRTKLPFDIQLRFPNRLVAAVQCHQSAAKMATKVKNTFCVRGVMDALIEDFDAYLKKTRAIRR